MHEYELKHTQSWWRSKSLPPGRQVCRQLSILRQESLLYIQLVAAIDEKKDFINGVPKRLKNESSTSP